MAKPSLKSLMDAASPSGRKPRRSKKKKAAPPATQQQLAMARALFVRRFVTEFLRLHMNAAGAFRALRPDVTKKSAKVLACELLQCEDIHAELSRQLRGISASADLDEEWVKRQWRAMAHSNIFDYVTVEPTTGNVTAFNMGREQLTVEQQLNVRRLKFDPKTGRVVDLELVDRKSAVDSVARALKMFQELEDSSLASLAQEITERMQRASKTVRTFDNDTGAEIEGPGRVDLNRR